MKWRKTLSWISALAITSINPVAAQQLYPNKTNLYQKNQPIQIFVPPPESNKRGICAAFLEPAIGEVINRYQGKWGILVERLADGKTIYHYNADLGLIPASNIKILTTAAALQKLDPQTPIRSNKSLREWVTVTNLRSNNFYADTLLKYIGGSGVAKQALSELGVNPRSFYLADGSGLSRRNAATPRALVETLKAMYSTPGRDIFFASLPTAGISGTLRNRLKQTPAQGVVHAKTGTLRGVRALSGYMNHPEYGVLVFSILVNQPNQPGNSLVRAIDEIVLRLNMTTSCE
jgi:D-alanyl-D-alanine carboxypeptidase/D-alanyl-D-alanine-endopeptidase (penicillin-binding protein 4)